MNTLHPHDSASHDNFRNARLLIVEDNPDHGIIIEHVLRQSLPEVKFVLVRTEEEALAYVEQCRLAKRELPQLILLDLYLPNREDGWRLLERIKSIPDALGKTPVVVLSNSTNQSDIAETYDRGCSSYLVKPIGTDNWLAYFQMLRTYWWETVTLPKADGYVV